MQWYNEPKQWQQDGEKLTVQCDGKTDYWRVTRHDYIVDNASFYQNAPNAPSVSYGDVGRESL